MIDTAVILSAGKSSRLEPLEVYQNKGLLTIGGMSLAERTVKVLAEQGITKVICIISPKDKTTWQGIAEKVEQLLKIKLTCLEQPEPKGMADALLTAREHLSQDFLVVFPYHYEQAATIEALVNHPSAAVVIDETDQPSLYGIVCFDKDRKLASLVEKPTTITAGLSYKLVGLYRLSRGFIEELQNHTGEYAFEAALNAYAQQTSVKCISPAVTPISLKYAWHLLDHLQAIVAQQPSRLPSLGSTVVVDETNGPVHIEDGAEIGHFTVLKGPLYIGRNAFVGDHCLIRESALEEGCVVGAYTEVARSLLMEHVKIHYSYVADSVIGTKSNIGAGLLTTNKRLDRRTIRVTVKKELVDSGKKGLGALIGPNTVFGSRVTTMPGTVIEVDTVVLPNSVLPDKTKQSYLLKESKHA